MTPASLNLQIYKGVKFGPVTITCSDSDGAAVDLTGYTAYAEVRNRPAGTLAFDLEPAISDAAAGEITLEMDDADTEDLVCGRYGWDLVLEDGDGVRTGPYVSGSVLVSELYTQP